MVAYVIVPGLDGSDDIHWQSFWEREWAEAAVRTAPSSWTEPDLDDWTVAVGAAVARASRGYDDTVLVAHSLGCWAVAAWAETVAPQHVSAALLVAPPDPNGPSFPRAVAGTFVDIPARPLPFPALVVGSDDDPYASTAAVEKMAVRWNAQWHMAGRLGHINSASELGEWQQGREMLQGLLGNR